MCPDWFGYRLHCWFGDAHSHASREDAADCINHHQPGSMAARALGCDCAIGHLHYSCPFHGPMVTTYTKPKLSSQPQGTIGHMYGAACPPQEANP